MHFHWYNNKDMLVPMRKIYLSNNISNANITLTNDHFIYKMSKNDESIVVAAKDVIIGDKLYYYNVNLVNNNIEELSVIKIEDNIYGKKRAFWTMSKYVLVNNIIASPFVGPSADLHDFLYKILLTIEGFWNWTGLRLSYPNILWIEEFICSNTIIIINFIVYTVYFVYTGSIVSVFVTITALFFFTLQCFVTKNNQDLVFVNKIKSD